MTGVAEAIRVVRAAVAGLDLEGRLRASGPLADDADCTFLTMDGDADLGVVVVHLDRRWSESLDDPPEASLFAVSVAEVCDLPGDALRDVIERRYGAALGRFRRADGPVAVGTLDELRAREIRFSLGAKT